MDGLRGGSCTKKLGYILVAFCLGFFGKGKIFSVCLGLPGKSVLKVLL